jgi:hypothetical protein
MRVCALLGLSPQSIFLLRLQLKQKNSFEISNFALKMVVPPPVLVCKGLDVHAVNAVPTVLRNEALWTKLYRAMAGRISGSFWVFSILSRTAPHRS